LSLRWRGRGLIPVQLRRTGGGGGVAGFDALRQGVRSAACPRASRSMTPHRSRTSDDRVAGMREVATGRCAVAIWLCAVASWLRAVAIYLRAGAFYLRAVASWSG
jgi:hypothetical protein